MLDMRSSSRRVARFMIRPTLVRMKTATGTRTRNISVSCQLIQQATTTQAERLERLGDHLAEQRLDAGAQHLHVVGEAGHQLVRALLAELVDVQVDDVAVEAIAQVEQGQIDDAADQRFLPELEEALDGHRRPPPGR